MIKFSVVVIVMKGKKRVKVSTENVNGYIQIEIDSEVINFCVNYVNFIRIAHTIHVIHCLII